MAFHIAATVEGLPGSHSSCGDARQLELVAGVAVVVAALVLAIGGSAQASPAAPSSPRVLFVGNSLTETNDLPAVVSGLAHATGRALEYRTIAFGGYLLEDHWHQGDARAALASRGWDVVVLQQGPSALPESQANLREWATRFADEARQAGTRPALLTVWPESYRRGVLTEVIASYRRAAEAANTDLLPGGGAWRWAWRCDPRIALYGRDGFHPSARHLHRCARRVRPLVPRPAGGSRRASPAACHRRQSAAAPEVRGQSVGSSRGPALPLTDRPEA